MIQTRENTAVNIHAPMVRKKISASKHKIMNE